MIFIMDAPFAAISNLERSFQKACSFVHCKQIPTAGIGYCLLYVNLICDVWNEGPFPIEELHGAGAAGHERQAAEKEAAGAVLV